MRWLNTYINLDKIAQAETTQTSEFDMNTPIQGGNMPETGVPSVSAPGNITQQQKTQMKSPLQLGNPNYRSHGSGNTSTKN
jgi:hypothetical protein